MAYTLSDCVIGGVFGVWFAASVVNQFFSKGNVWLAKLDPFRLVPQWRFFAPRPGVTDFHLVVRDWSPGPGQWREVPVIHERTSLSCVWHPGKRLAKAVLDYVGLARRGSRGDAGNSVVVSIAYLGLLNFVLRAMPLPRDGGRQFAVLETPGFQKVDTPRLVIRSEVHRL